MLNLLRMSAQRLLHLLSLLAISAGFAAEPEFSDVFTSGAEGYVSIRIPSVLVTKTGTLLAFAEGRQRPQDQAENDIIMKRSNDGGRSWSALRVLHDDGANSLNNPTAVQERETARIFLWYQRIPAHLKERNGEIATGTRRAEYLSEFHPDLR
jgi:sialidase-1